MTRAFYYLPQLNSNKTRQINAERFAHIGEFILLISLFNRQINRIWTATQQCTQYGLTSQFSGRSNFTSCMYLNNVLLVPTIIMSIN